MTLEESLQEAARRAALGVREAMRKYSRGEVLDEDDLTAVLAGQLDAKLRGQVGGLNWTASVVRHRRGVAAEEKRIGADLLIHVRLRAREQRYSKGVLVQAKRVEPGDLMAPKAHLDLLKQCDRMLDITPASFVFDYTKSGMRCASATKVSGSSNRALHAVCNVTPYRFFYELFRCPIGDPNIQSGLVSELPVPLELTLDASGDVGDE